MASLTAKLVATLACFVNRDDAGRHFTESYPDQTIADLELLGVVAIARPVHQATGIAWDESHWTAEVTPVGIEVVQAADRIEAQAKADAAAFFAEFGEALDPATTDWDATAWGDLTPTLHASDDALALLWDLYQEILVAETERLADESAARNPGFYTTDVEVFYVAKTGRAWIVASPDFDGIKAIAAADIPATAVEADALVGADAAGYLEQVAAEEPTEEAGAIRYEVRRGHTWVALDAAEVRWEVKEEAEASDDSVGAIAAGGQTYRWSRPAPALPAGTRVAIYYHHNGIREWAGTGTWDGSSVECSADLPMDVYGAIDAMLLDGTLVGEVEHQGVTYSFDAAD